MTAVCEKCGHVEDFREPYNRCVMRHLDGTLATDHMFCHRMWATDVTASKPFRPGITNVWQEHHLNAVTRL